MEERRMQRTATVVAVLTLVLLAGRAVASEVWRVEFDSGVDGVVDLFDNNSGKVMIGPVVGGRLQIESWDNTTDAYTPDKAGRPLGVTLNGQSSFSGLYQFHWSTLNAVQAQAYELAGFLGTGGSPQTRQVCGAIIRHWKVSSTYYAAVDLAFGSVGYTNFGYLAGSAISLGTNPFANDYQFAVGYEGGTHVLSVQLFDAAGNLLGGVTADLDTDVPGLQGPGTPAQEIGALVLNHLGWSDYTGSGGDRATIWQVDALAYYDTADGAANAAQGISPPTGACCLPDESCAADQTESQCDQAGGTWQGADTTCGTVDCTIPRGACCRLDETCLADQTAAECIAVPGFWQGEGSLCGQVDCSLPDPGNEPWDVYYDGVDSAADNVPNFLRWDSALDDDWNDFGLSFWLNTPEPGFFTVDRVTNPADHIKTGNIWIRDPVLSHAAGLTLEVSVLIMPNSMLDAYSITCLDDAGSFGVHLSPDRIKVGSLAQNGYGDTFPFDTTDGFHLYRVVKSPGSYAVTVYADGSPVPIASGVGSTSYAVGSSPYLKYPRVLVGDNSNATIYNAHYICDLVRYRRGATAPGETPPTLPPRVLPAPPPPATGAETWTVGYEGLGMPVTGSGWIVGGASASWTYLGDGTTDLNTLTYAANARMDGVLNWPNTAAVTVETRVKVLPDSQEGGFNLVVNDQVGQTALVLSPDKAELQHAYMPLGQATVPMDTTDGFHVYRVTRDADGIYWHLFIDDDPVAAVPYQHAGGDLLSFSRVWFGDVGFPIPSNGCHVIIDYIRWFAAHTAPVRTADLDRDGDADHVDAARFQACFGDAVAESCLAADLDGDGDADHDDYVNFEACLGGPDVPMPPGCAPE
jgi:hypothetical protein